MFTVNWRIRVNDTLPRVYWAEYMLIPGEWRRVGRFDGVKLFDTEKAVREWVSDLIAFEARISYPPPRKQNI